MAHGRQATEGVDFGDGARRHPTPLYEIAFAAMLVVQFMDAANLDLRALKKSCVHIVQPDGRMIPFEAFNLFFRGDGAA